MKLNHISATAAFALLAPLAYAGDTAFSLETRSGDTFLSGPNGKGQTNALRFETQQGSGLIVMRAGQIRDQASNVYLDSQTDILGMGTLAARADWNIAIKTKFLEVQKSFRVFNRPDVSYGLYLGYAEASAAQNANVNFAAKAISLHIPGYSAYGYTTRAYNLSLPAHTSTLYDEGSTAQDKSPYGGLLFAADLPIQVGKRSQLRASISAQVGAERMGYAVGASYIYATQPLADDRQLPGGACTGNPYNPKSGFAFTASICRDKTVKSPLYDAEIRKAGEYVNKLNGYASQLNAYAAGVKALTGHDYNVPTDMTAQDVMDTLGLPNPMTPQVSLKLGVAGTYGKINASAFTSIPLSGIKNKQVGVSLGYRF